MKSIPNKVGIGEMAAILGISTKQLQNYRDAGKIRFSGKGRGALYDITEVIQDYTTIQIDKATKGYSTVKQDAQERKLEAEARLAEIKVEQLAGRLVDVAEMEAVLDKILISLRQEILSVPAKWTTQLVGKMKPEYMQKELTRLTDDLLLIGLDKAIEALNENVIEELPDDIKEDN